MTEEELDQAAQELGEKWIRAFSIPFIQAMHQHIRDAGEGEAGTDEDDDFEIADRAMMAAMTTALIGMYRVPAPGQEPHWPSVFDAIGRMAQRCAIAMHDDAGTFTIVADDIGEPTGNA